MDKKRHLESRILLDLLSATDEESPVPIILTAQLFSACQPTFERAYQYLPEKVRKDLFVEAYAELLLKMEDEPDEYAKAVPFSHHFLEQFATTISESELCTPDTGNVVGEEDLQHFKHLEAKVLFELLRIAYKPAEEKVYRTIRSPLLAILKHKYYFTNLDPEIVYNEAIADGIDFIRKGNIDRTLNAGLLTFFTRFARNKLLNINNSARKRKEHLTETGAEIDTMPGNSDVGEDSYFDGLLQRIVRIERSGIGTAKELIAKLLKCVGAPHNRYLDMFFLKRMTYETMEEILAGEGQPKKQGALRKGVYDGLKKARKCLNLI